ncbi:MAG: VWA domain-containing protein [Alphaproteobacteria bacterium]
MFVDFFFKLRENKVPVTLREYLVLLEGLDKRIVYADVEAFYYLARTCLVKDEKNYDRFDRTFGEYFKGIIREDDEIDIDLPEEWLRQMAEKLLSDEEKAQIEALGGWDKLMETLRERLKEQQGAHHGGKKWIGTGGTSPFGNAGYNPEGIRIGGKGGNRRAVKVWEKREFKNYDDTIELGVRNIKIALRRLRKFARQGAPDQLDLPDTIRSTAKNAGYLDLKLVPERRNAVKVLIFFDVGGSMDDHVRVCEELFSAVRTEFKHLEYFYFHNFVYESVWKDNSRRHTLKTPLTDVLNTYGPDYRVIFVGDATMSPYEITHPGGSVEHWNEEAGAIWARRILNRFEKAVWLNPEPVVRWERTPSIRVARDIMEGRMFPLTIQGLEEAMTELSR